MCVCVFFSLFLLFSARVSVRLSCAAAPRPSWRSHDVSGMEVQWRPTRTHPASTCEICEPETTHKVSEIHFFDDFGIEIKDIYQKIIWFKLVHFSFSLQRPSFGFCFYNLRSRVSHTGHDVWRRFFHLKWASNLLRLKWMIKGVVGRWISALKRNQEKKKLSIIWLLLLWPKHEEPVTRDKDWNRQRSRDSQHQSLELLSSKTCLGYCRQVPVPAPQKLLFTISQARTCMFGCLIKPTKLWKGVYDLFKFKRYMIYVHF